MVAVRAVLVEYVKHMREINTWVQKPDWCSIHMYEYVPDPDQPHLAVQLPNLELCPPAMAPDDDDVGQDVLAMLVDDGPVPLDEVSSGNSSSVHEIPEQEMGEPGLHADEQGDLGNSTSSSDGDEWDAHDLHHLPPVADVDDDGYQGPWADYFQ
jgi:hypothetical protein